MNSPDQPEATASDPGAEHAHRRRIDIVRDDDFLADVETLPLPELRRRRTMCDELEFELSYYRRLLHGRIDLLAFEARRRSGEEQRSLIEALPEILADAPSEPRSIGAAPPRALPIETPQLPNEGRRAVDRALQDDFLARLPTLESAELDRVRTLLDDVEREVSSQRQAVYAASERLHQELTRRYREGEADVDELLRSGG